jgi:hypothetical protein
MIMPARLGELVRPPPSADEASPFQWYRRYDGGAVFDLSGLLLLLGFVLWTTPQIPRIYSILGQVLLVMLAVGYVLVLLVSLGERVEGVVTRLLSRLPARGSLFGRNLSTSLDSFGLWPVLNRS